MNIVGSVQLFDFDASTNADLRDKFVWWYDAKGYSVKYVHGKLSSILNADFHLDAQSKVALNNICISNVSVIS